MKHSASEFQLVQKAYVVIKKAIVTLKLKPGEQLTETRLAETLGISKTPIREALWRLYQEGFVEREPFRGAFVSRIRTQDVRELFELREYLEPIAVRDAVETLSDEEIREIEGLVKEGEQAYQSGDYDKASDYIRLFHDRLIWKVKNTRIRDILTNLDDHLDRIRHISIRISGLPARTFTDHKKIVEALRRRNAEQAEALVRDHVRLILEVFLSEDASNRLSWFSVGEQDILQIK